jgi:hypothetical protein
VNRRGERALTMDVVRREEWLYIATIQVFHSSGRRGFRLVHRCSSVIGQLVMKLLLQVSSAQFAVQWISLFF